MINLCIITFVNKGSVFITKNSFGSLSGYIFCNNQIRYFYQIESNTLNCIAS